MINTLFVLNIIVVVLLIFIVLMQKSSGGVLGMGGGSKNAMFSVSSAGNLVTKITYFLGAAFFVICILLAFIIARENGNQKSFIQKMMSAEDKKSAEVAIDKTPADAAKPAAPKIPVAR